ncbi:MAG: hypothetical protein KME54_18905 [Tolypothrix brevis GSE-NOS-MK-07-07A]|jgi:hypothetical protein|nr:hypothetical protein [Tolypothrix brevis GSE-NOS-MK-07-07A]
MINGKIYPAIVKDALLEGSEKHQRYTNEVRMVRGLNFVETFRRNVFTSGFTHQFSNAEFETRVGGFCLYSREFHSPGVFFNQNWDKSWYTSRTYATVTK